MTPIPSLIIAAICFVLAGVLEIAEQKSRKWYDDRLMLRASGLFLGLGLVFVGLALF